MANAQTLTSITGLLSSLMLWSTAIFVPQIPTCAPATTEADTISAGVAFQSGGRCYSVLTLDHSLGRKTFARTATGIAPLPRVTAKKGLDVAVQDFLTAWLLQAQARFAVPYISVRSYPCLEAISENRGRSVPAGVIRYELLNAMGRYAKAIGPVKNLDEIVSPVKLSDPA